MNDGLQLKPTRITWLLILIFTLRLVLLPPFPALADEPIQLVLRHLPLQDDRLLVVTVQLEQVTDLYGAEIQLRYDPGQLKARDEDLRLEGVQIAPGPLLAFDDRFVALNQADAQTGLIDFVFTMLKPAPPINKAGVLATVAFEVVGSGPYKIEVSEAKFVSSQLTAVPVATTDLTLAELPALETTRSQPSALISPLVWVGAVMGILGAAAILFLLLRQPWRAKTPVNLQPAQRRTPEINVSSSQTAALLAEQGRRAMQQGDAAQAYERFNQAIELNPANALAWLGKGLAAQQAAEKRICFQRALALEPDNTEAKEALQNLEP